MQTPLLGAAAAELRIGDRVYMRHAKAGELCERFDALHLVEGGAIVDVVPTYRGEGKAFLYEGRNRLVTSAPQVRAEDAPRTRW